MPIMQRVGVLAGSYRDFTYWLYHEAEPPFNRYYYLRDADALHGIRLERVIYTSSAHMNEAYDDEFWNCLIHAVGPEGGGMPQTPDGPEYDGLREQLADSIRRADGTIGRECGYPDLVLISDAEDVDEHGDMKGMTLDEWQAHTDRLIREVQESE